MRERPELNRNLDGSTFDSYYYLKEELVSFYRVIIVMNRLTLPH